MKIKSSNTINSSIVAMGARLQKAMEETGAEYLLLNRGVNSVVNIDLSAVVSQIDFNSNDIQVYPGGKGKVELKKAINKEYFNNTASLNNILITGGGISGLDICFQNIDVDEIIFPKFFWGTYAQLCNIRNIAYSCYDSYENLSLQAAKYSGKAVIICDPGNPLGEKYPDKELLEIIKRLDKNGVVVVFDSPYRRLFYNRTDDFYEQLSDLENVVIIESFSKALGLSGQRIGFIYNCNDDFINEAALRILYATNGVNSFAQVLVSKLLSTPLGIEAVEKFKEVTTLDISRNIKFLQDNNLLANDLYTNSEPLGIFSVVKFSPKKLFKHRIGCVGLDYFVNTPFKGMENYSRILVSYPHEKFVSFFRTLL
ncbi:MAG: pyridoxal phosphate-dependent aminotransferase [Salinivirgaceae bacterium]|jgi:aspartate aminotransferase|nr:pyridoxal phosphate-dependent aminotransferase [Salinivirgaceae bacterium]